MHTPTYDDVRALLDAGMTRKQVQMALGLTKGQVSGLIFRATSLKYEHRLTSRTTHARLIATLEDVLQRVDPRQSDERFTAAWRVLAEAA